MNGLSTYNKILISLLTKNMITKAAIIAGSECTPQGIYKFLAEGCRRNHIKRSAIEYKKRGRKRTVVFYSITTEGVRYLSKQCFREAPWLAYIPHNISRVKVRARSCSALTLERFMRVTSASMMAEGMGAKTSPLFLVGEQNVEDNRELGETGSTVNAGDEGEQEDRWWEENYEDEYGEVTGEAGNCEAGSYEVCEADDGEADEDSSLTNRGLTLASIVTDAMRKYEAAQGQNQNRTINEETDYQIFFRSSFEIKTAIGVPSQGANKGNADARFGRYVGIFESCYKSVLFYTGTTSGFSWPERALEKEVSSFKQYDGMVSQFKNIRYNDIRAGIFVQNAKVFSDIYLDKHGCREKGEELGSRFTHFYAVPMSEDGREMLRDIMTTNDREQREYIVNAAAESGMYRKNEELDKELFPLVNLQSGSLVMIGSELDIIMMRRLEGLIKRFGDLNYGILCKPWQIDFYRRIFPKSKYMTME